MTCVCSCDASWQFCDPLHDSDDLDTCVNTNMKLLNATQYQSLFTVNLQRQFEVKHKVHRNLRSSTMYPWNHLYKPRTQSQVLQNCCDLYDLPLYSNRRSTWEWRWAVPGWDYTTWSHCRAWASTDSASSSAAPTEPADRHQCSTAHFTRFFTFLLDFTTGIPPAIVAQFSGTSTRQRNTAVSEQVNWIACVTILSRADWRTCVTIPRKA